MGGAWGGGGECLGSACLQQGWSLLAHRSARLPASSLPPWLPPRHVLPTGRSPACPPRLPRVQAPPHELAGLWAQRRRACVQPLGNRGGAERADMAHRGAQRCYRQQVGAWAGQAWLGPGRMQALGVEGRPPAYTASKSRRPARPCRPLPRSPPSTSPPSPAPCSYYVGAINRVGTETFPNAFTSGDGKPAHKVLGGKGHGNFRETCGSPRTPHTLGHAPPAPKTQHRPLFGRPTHAGLWPLLRQQLLCGARRQPHAGAVALPRWLDGG